MENLIKYSVVFGPTVLFALIVLIRVLIGYFSGARRQVIFIIHSIVAFIICLILYFVLVENKVFDKFILDVVNKFMGKDGLEQALGVNPSCKTMREVIVQYIPSQMGFVEGLELILKDNGAYLLALVNVCYHIILALVLYYVYLLLNGIFFIVYLFAYSERKHKKKKNAKYEDGIEETPYYKHKKYGAAIGFARGIVRGLIVLSFLGTALFIINGIGNKNRAQYKTDNESYDLGFTIYKEIGNYGEYGIFKVLNMCKDKNDVPYYLYAADLVYQGGLKDDTRGIDTNIYLREELNAYVEFSTDTFDLLMKYGSEELTPIILGQYSGNAMDVILEIMANPKFQAEFKLLIDSFDAKTYFVNFALSLVDSICANVNEVGFMNGLSPDAIDVISIAFKPGYLSDTISFEKELKSSGKKVELGYIKPSNLLTSDDARLVLNALLEVININEIYKNDKNFGLKVVDGVVTYVKKLSILNSNRSDELNPVLKRLYAFVDAKYLVATSTNNEEVNDTAQLRKQKKMEEIIYKSDYYNNIDWVNELNLLVNSVEDVLLIYEDVFIGNRDPFTAILEIFNEDSRNYSRNIKLYHDLVNRLEYSKVLGEAISSSLVNDAIEKTMSTVLVEGFTIPKNIVYATEEIDGELYHGELYYFLKGIEKLCSNTRVGDKNIKIIDEMLESEDLDTEGAFNLLADISSVFASKEDNVMYAEELFKSKMLRSLLSGFMVKNGSVSSDFSIHIDDSIIEDNVVDYDELVEFFRIAPDVLELVRPIILDGSSTTKDLVNLIKSDAAKEALNSKIFEGTFSNLLYNYFKDSSDNFLVFPEFFINKRKWVSTNVEDSEIKKLIKGLNETNFDLDAFLDGDNDKMVDAIKKLDNSQTTLLLDSAILYYSISNYISDKGETLISDMPIIVPEVSKIYDEVKDEKGKYIKLETYRIEKNTLTVLLSNVDLFTIEKDTEGKINISKLFNDILREDKAQNGNILNNNIINATVALSVCSDGGLIHSNLSDQIVIPEFVKEYATVDRLKNEFNTSNPWKRETKYLVYGIKYLLGDKFDENYDLANVGKDVENELRHLLDVVEGSNSTKIEEIYKSNILASTFTKGIKDKAYDPNIDNPDTGDAFLVHTNIAYKPGTSVYKIEEIEALIKMVKERDKQAGVETETPFEDLDIIVLNDNVVDIIRESSLMCASITKAMVDYGKENTSKIIILKRECFDGTNILSGDYVRYFINGIRQMTEKVLTIDYFTDKDGFSVGELHIPEDKDKLKIIEKSKTLLATVTNNISVKVVGSDPDADPVKLYFIDDKKYCQKVGGSFYMDIESNDVAIMTNEEFENMIKYSSNSLTYNLDLAYEIEHFDYDVNNYPNMVYNLISDYFIKMCPEPVKQYYRNQGIIEEKNIVYIKGCEKTTIEYIEKENFPHLG